MHAFALWRRANIELGIMLWLWYLALQIAPPRNSNARA